MSLAALMTALSANAVGAVTVPLERSGFLEPRAPAASNAPPIKLRRNGSTPPSRAPDEPTEYPAISHPDASERLDLAVHLGDRRTWPQLELGAFAGTPRGFSLVHVGLGFDF